MEKPSWEKTSERKIRTTLSSTKRSMSQRLRRSVHTQTILELIPCSSYHGGGYCPLTQATKLSSNFLSIFLLLDRQKWWFSIDALKKNDQNWQWTRDRIGSNRIGNPIESNDLRTQSQETGPNVFDRSNIDVSSSLQEYDLVMPIVPSWEQTLAEDINMDSIEDWCRALSITKTLHVHVWHKDSHIDGTRSSSRQTEGEQSLSTFQMRRKWLNQRITADGSRLANIIMVFDWNLMAGGRRQGSLVAGGNGTVVVSERVVSSSEYWTVTLGQFDFMCIWVRGRDFRPLS